MIRRNGDSTPGAEALTGAAWKDVEALAMKICERLGLDPKYAHGVDIEIGRVTVHLFKGKDGRCTGPKYVEGAGEYRLEDDERGKAAREIVVFELASGEVLT